MKRRREFEQALIIAFDDHCACCGKQFPYYVYQFHHIDARTKEQTIASILANHANADIIANEAEKCIMICANCHRKLHHGDAELLYFTEFKKEIFFDSLYSIKALRTKTRNKTNRNKSNEKPVIMCNSETGQQIHTFQSLHQAATFIGNKKCTGNISKAANGILKTAYGYQWKFTDDYS